MTSEFFYAFCEISFVCFDPIEHDNDFDHDIDLDFDDGDYISPENEFENVIDAMFYSILSFAQGAKHSTIAKIHFVN